MKSFVFCVLFLCAVAGSTVGLLAKLTYPQFLVGKTQTYDLVINMTASVPGMHSQVAKSVLMGELKIFAKSKKDLIMTVSDVKVSGSLPSVNSDADHVVLKGSKILDDLLKLPIKSRYENGKIKSFTIDHKDTLESKKIKKTVLRNLQLYLDKKVLRPPLNEKWPATYNITRTNSVGSYVSHYVVTHSPYEVFPHEFSVFNISRTDNYEVLPYETYKTHHNFEVQGCRKECKQNQRENAFGAGCPLEYEQFQTPMKRSFVQQHNLRTLPGGALIIDSVKTKETHVADIYEQNMQVTITSMLRYKTATLDKIKEKSGQFVYSNLDDFSYEIKEAEVANLCGHASSEKKVKIAKTLLQQVAEIVVRGDIGNRTSNLIGEKVFLLRKVLTNLKQIDLRHLEHSIVSYYKMEHASEIDIVKRQIWLDILPVIGTEDSTSYITNIIQENVNKPDKSISLWEASSVLAAVPSNLKQVTGRTLLDLMRLLELVSERNEPGYTIFYSASYLTVARAIAKACVIEKGAAEDEDEKKLVIDEINLILQKLSPKKQRKPAFTCSKPIVNRFVDDVVSKLTNSDDIAKSVIYIETLSRTALQEVLPYLLPYLYGKVSDLSPSDIDFMKLVAIKSLHNVVDYHPLDIQHLVLPIFFNRSEVSKARIAAFSVLLKTDPSLGILQEIAQKTWEETSLEVGSFVTSILDSYANASLPCLQLLAHRIKLVISQVKRFDIGIQHSKDFLWTLFDEKREFGLSKELMYAASNESIIPSIFYYSLAFYDRSFEDHLYQSAITTQGMSANDLLDHVLKFLGLKEVDIIPKNTESSIFPKTNVVPRDQESWKMTMYNKMFYTVTYNYFDASDVKKQEIVRFAEDFIQHYFRKDDNHNVMGHLVKLFVPSSYHTEAIARTLPYPVEFKRENLLLFSLKFKFKYDKDKASKKLKLLLEPSAYLSTQYTNEMLNLRDCKTVGVYHTNKVAFSDSVELEFAKNNNGKYNFTFRFPVLPKQTFSFHSEAGTYSGAYNSTTLPIMGHKVPIETLPARFKRRDVKRIYGFPPISTETLSEDLLVGFEETPKDLRESVIRFIEKYQNTGWRRKSINVTRLTLNNEWSTKTTGTLTVAHARHYPKNTSKSTENLEDLIDSFKRPCFIKFMTKDDETYAKERNIIQDAFRGELPSLEDTFKIRYQQSEKGNTNLTIDTFLDFNRTLDGKVYHMEMNTTVKIRFMVPPMSVNVSFLGLANDPVNIFKYNDKSYDKQIGGAGLDIEFGKKGLYANFSFHFRSVFARESLNKTIGTEFETPVMPEVYLPDTHKECIEDVKKGNEYSLACIKAIRERSLYNHVLGNISWSNKSPDIFDGIVERIEDYLKIDFSKYTYGAIMNKEEPFISFNGNYIEKFTDEPIFDLVIGKEKDYIRRRMPSPFYFPYSHVKIFDGYKLKATNNSYPVTCALTDKYVTTFDMVNYRLPLDIPKCTYILSAHCMKRKKFAVMAKFIARSPGTKEIHMYLGKDTVILTPQNKSEVYNIKYNNKHVAVPALKVVTLNLDSQIFAYAHDWSGGILVVEGVKAGVKVTYNGKNVFVEVSPKYKGEACGLCGDFNGEPSKEFLGVDGCLYSDSSDFAKSCTVNHCVDSTPSNPYICGKSKNFADFADFGKESTEPEELLNLMTSDTRLRNIVLSREDKFCFSIEPQPVCEEDSEPKETEDTEIDFVCYPKNNLSSKHMLVESSYRILTELEGLDRDFAETVPVARSC